MSGSIPAARQHLISAIADSGRRLRGRTHGARLDEFIASYFRGVDEDDLRTHAPAALAAAAAAHLGFGTERQPGTPKVRVYNPPIVEGSAAATVIEIVTDDMPFLVDSMAMVLGQSGLSMQFMVHPLLQAFRDRAGRLKGFGAPAEAAGGSAVIESWQRIAIDRVTEPARLEALSEQILAVLDDVRVTVEDWPTMRQHAITLARDVLVDVPGISRSEELEASAFLEWLSDNHFTFLGYREYRLLKHGRSDVLEPVKGTGLGLMRDGHGHRDTSSKVLPREIGRRAREPQVVVVTKANSVSTVHRASYLDYVGIKRFDARGRVTGERRFIGLFTSTAYSASPRDIPLLRHKVQRVIDLIGISPVSHDGKALLHVLESYPRDDLFQASVAELVRTSRGIVNLYERRRVRLFLRRDPYRRFYSCQIFVPRDRYNTDVRGRIEKILLEELAGDALETQVRISESALARLHVLVRTAPESEVDADVERIETRITEAVRTWSDRLRDALRNGLENEERAARLADRYAEAFSLAYQAEVDTAEAIVDLEQIEAIPADSEVPGLRLRAGSGGARGTLVLRLYRRGEPLAMSDILPLLENFGLRILNEQPYRVATPDGKVCWIQDVEVVHAAGRSLAPSAIDERFREAFYAVWHGRAESDGFNRLVLGSDLHWRSVLVLRAIARYLLQTVLFSQGYMETVLARHPTIAAALARAFELRFDPAQPAKSRAGRVASVDRELDLALEQVTSPDEDRILRAFRSVVSASLRTNHYQRSSDGEYKPYLSVKLDPQKVPVLPKPRPLFEIWVYSPRVEGVHLRMSRVARGGLRWSDRREDFRTEILGLMKAQNVKNTVIVPQGAKGGFVPKRLAGSREELQREGVECYRLFIRGLLDLTDNIDGKGAVKPANLVRYDGDDPYLVVAADKGTATFSDVANALAAEYDFWLGDAFASGGSAGYDHKKMGITAKGAWESVKRHFRELGLDTQTQEFTVAGIGDLSGDVFGNGMLLSRKIRLVAAFNHQHIFLDPEPDPERSFRERERMFKLPRSAWSDYDAKVLSKGGAVLPRNAKELTLSPQARELLGLDSVKATPTEVIRAILRMPVDLLWNGGIGTYVKASWESDAAAGDRTNDAVRVDGRELRCRVVGEGGNLGLTQLGRVEYALNGGRCNTDFIDNSGGVDCSDHEVNIKILLEVVQRRRKLAGAARNRLLAQMTDEVADLVLRDNYLQSQALSLVERTAAMRLGEHAHVIRSLELDGLLDRTIEFLPGPEQLEERRSAGKGLTRPELAMLMSYAKIALNAQLRASDIAEDSYLRRELDRYFPARIVARYADLLTEHRLQREIICTATTNSVINRMGPTFLMRAQQDLGADAATVTRAYTIAREACDARALWTRIEALDNKVRAATQYDMILDTAALLRQVCYWLVQHCRGALGIEAQVERLRPGMIELVRGLPGWLGAEEAASFRARVDALGADGVPADLARSVAGLSALHSAPDIIELAKLAKLSVTDAARAYVATGSALGLDWLRQSIGALDTHGHWHAVARGTLREAALDAHRRITQRILASGRERDPAKALARWTSTHAAEVAHARDIIDDIRAQAAVDFASLSVALQAVRRLAGNEA